MKLKFCIIIICLLIFGCKSKEEPNLIERIGTLVPGGGGGTPALEVYVDKEDRQYDIYYLSFRHPSGVDWYKGDYNTLPFGKKVKVIGEDSSHWAAEDYYKLHILVKSMEVLE